MSPVRALSLWVTFLCTYIEYPIDIYIYIYIYIYGLVIVFQIVIFILYRAIKRGIKITKKYLNDQKDISQLDITKTDIKGRNIFHLSVQTTELLEFLLEKFSKVG